MIENNAIFFIIIAITQCFFSLCIFVAWKKISEDQKTLLSAQKNTYKELEKLLTQGLNDSEDLLNTVRKKQLEMLTQLDTFHLHLESEMNTAINTHVQNFAQKNDLLLTKTNDTVHKELDKLVSNMTTTAEKQVQELLELSSSLKNSYSQQLVAAYDQALAKTSEQASIYLEKQRKEIEEKIEQKVAQITKDFFAQSTLTIDQHAQVMKLLDKHLPTV